MPKTRPILNSVEKLVGESAVGWDKLAERAPAHHEALAEKDGLARDRVPGYRLVGRRGLWAACPTLRLFRPTLILLVFLLAGCRSLRSDGDPLASYEDEPARAERVSWRDFTPKGVQSNVKHALGKGPDETAARGMYQEGEDLFRQAIDADEDDRQDLFVEAGKKYTAAAARWPDSLLEEDSLFMQGECLFFADNYSKSREAYDRLVKKYPNTRHIDKIDARRFDIAQYWLTVYKDDPKFFLTPNFTRRLPRNDTYGHAVRVFDKIRLDDPTGRLADDATMAAGVAYYDRGDYQQADRFFADLRRTYPDSEHYFDAALRSIKAKLEMHQGSEYDSATLEDGQELIKVVFQQFPDEARQNQEFLDNAYKQIRLKLASRDWEMARFFDGRGEYRGARYYYNKVVEDFSDTSLAADSEKRLAEISDRRDKPENHFEWLTEALPKPKNQGKPLLSGDPYSWFRR